MHSHIFASLSSHLHVAGSVKKKKKGDHQKRHPHFFPLGVCCRISLGLVVLARKPLRRPSRWLPRGRHTGPGTSFGKHQLVAVAKSSFTNTVKGTLYVRTAKFIIFLRVFP